MAKATASTNKNGTTFYTIEVTSSITSQTDTHVTVSWSSKVTFGDWYYFGIGLKTYVNGTLVAHKTGYTTSSGATCCSASGTIDIPKKSASRGISFYASTYSTEVGGYGGAGINQTAEGSLTVPAAGTPNPVTGASSSRISDKENRISWKTGATSAKPYTAVKVERSVNGGSFTQIASLDASAASYSDRTTSANAYYRYRIRAYNGVNHSAYAATGTTYNTPSAPKFVSMGRSAGVITATLSNAAKTAEGLRWQKTKTPGTESSWTGTTEVAGTVKSFTDSPTDGTWYYRARNYRGSLASAWAVSEPIVNICPPAAPVTVAPPPVIPASDERITFEWRHNPLDGSEQTAAQVRYSTDGGSSWKTLDVSGSAQTASIENAFAVGTVVTWGARTKGSHADYGPWSGNAVSTVKQAPSVSIEEPGAKVDRLPISVRLAYADESGELSSVRMAILDDGYEVWTREVDALSCSIAAAEFFPDEKQYTLRVEVRSSSTLTASAEKGFTVGFAKPQAATLGLSPDYEEGTIRMSVSVAIDESLVPPVGIDVYRVCRGSRVPIVGNLKDGMRFTDLFPPVNVPFEYEVVSRSEIGSVNRAVVPYTFRSPWWYLDGGNGVKAKGKWNPSTSISVTRPSKTRVRFAGRRWPVSYDDESNMEQTATFSCTLETLEEADAFSAIMSNGGRAYYRGGSGDSYHADVDLSLEPNVDNAPWWGTATVSLVRIDGDDL